jgi:hypothetical protein
MRKNIFSFIFLCISLSAKGQGCIYDSLHESLPRFEIDSGTRILPPMAFSLRRQCPDIGNQGDCQSCSAWAVVYYGMSIRDKRRIKPYSPYFICERSGKCAVGMKLSEALGIATRFVVPSVQEFSTCPQSCCIGATPSTIESYLTAIEGADAEKKLKYALTQGYPVILTMNLRSVRQEPLLENQFFWVLGGLASEKQSPLYHAVCVVGYDESENCIEIVNSKGKSWADGGFAKISFEHLLLTELDISKKNVLAYVLMPKQ